VKLLNDIVSHSVLTGRAIFVLAVMLLLAACASTQPGNVTPPLLHHTGPEVHVEDIDVLEISPAMEEFLQRYVLPYKSSKTRLDLLITAVSRSGALGFEYDETRTKTSSEAFKARTGNCVAFSNLMVALARRAGLNARYQEVFLRPEWSDYDNDTVLLIKHLNVVIETNNMSWVVDVSGTKLSQTERRKLIDDSYAKALYLNNIAVEALLDGDLPRSYAYMTHAIATDSGLPDTWVNLGVIYGRNNQLDDAAFALNHALRINSNEYSAMSNLYEVYVEQGRFEEAAEIEARVERYRRRNPYYLLRLSHEAVEQEQYDEAISLLRKAINKKEDDHKLYFAMAKTQYLSGETADAESSLLRAKELAPQDMMVFYDRPLNELVTEQ